MELLSLSCPARARLRGVRVLGMVGSKGRRANRTGSQRSRTVECRSAASSEDAENPEDFGMWRKVKEAWGARPWPQVALAALLLLAVTGIGRVLFVKLLASPPTWVGSFTEFVSLWLAYNVQKICSQNAFLKLVAVTLATMPIVVATGLAFAAFTRRNVWSAMLTTFGVLERIPAAEVSVDGNPRATAVLSVTHMIGLFTYAFVVGIVSEEVQSTVEALESGKTRIVEKGHTLVLNTNRSTPHLLRQWAAAQEERGVRSPVVILADAPRAELEAMATAVREECGLDVMTRSGLPYKLSDLKNVSAKEARTIIILNPAESAAVQVQPNAATLISLAALGVDQSRFVLQLPEHRAMKQHDIDTLTSAAGCHPGKGNSDRVVPVDALTALGEAAAQCAVSPGLADVYTAIFCHSANSPEVYCGTFRELDGLTFGEARRLFKKATLLGLHSGTDGVLANPLDSQLIAPKQTVFGLAANQAHFKPARKPLAASIGDWAKPARAMDVRCRHIVVAAFDKPQHDEIRALAQAIPPKGTLTVISEERVELPKGEVKVKWVQGHPASREVLEHAGAATADSLLIAGLSSWNNTEADVQALSTFAQLTDICLAKGRGGQPLHVVTEARGPLLEGFADTIQDAKVEAGGRKAVTADVLPTEEMAAGFMAQCAMQPQLSVILKELFDVEGARLVTAHPGSYLNDGEATTLATLEERSRAHGEIVVGYVSSDMSATVAVDKETVVRRDDVRALVLMTTKPA